MLQRALFTAIALFFLTMNVLLWRSEVSGRNQLGTSVPVETVWEKILTAPDHSSLEIRHRNSKIGYCRWSPNIGNELATGVRMKEGPPPEGMIRNVSGYTIDFDGNVFIPDVARIRFGFNLELTTNHLWNSFLLRLNLRPTDYIIRAVAGENIIHFDIEEEERRESHLIRPEDLRDPGPLLERFGGPFVGPLLKAAGLSLPDVASAPHSTLGVRWQARHDWMTLGHSRLRIYRLETNLLDRFKIAVLVSHVGEILRIELPNQVLLVNEALNL